MRAATIIRRIGVLLAAVLVLTPLLLLAPAAGAAGADDGTLDGVAPTPVWLQAASELILGRAATPAEVDDWAFVAHRDGRAAVTRLLVAGDEWAGERVDELYRRVLRRPADEQGRRYWVAQIADGGIRLEDVAVGFHAGDEYFRQRGGTDRGFVDALYVDVLGRRADGSGRAYWLDVLRRGASRLDVAGSFVGAIEARRLRVVDTYRTVLLRSPDPGGREYWAEQLLRIGAIDLAAHLAASDEFHRRATGRSPARVGTAPVGPGTAYPLASSWRAGCPVGPGDLVALEFDHWRDDGSLGRGVLIVHRSAANEITTLARAMHGFGFPLAQARPVDDFGGDDDRSMAADNSSGFNCRTVAGTSTWSQHAYGLAVDLNPVRNPYVRGSTVEPPAGAGWLDRSNVRPGMLVEGSPVIGTTDRLGWGWGGRWSSAKDYQHLSRSGR